MVKMKSKIPDPSKTSFAVEHHVQCAIMHRAVAQGAQQTRPHDGLSVKSEEHLDLSSNSVEAVPLLVGFAQPCCVCRAHDAP